MNDLKLPALCIVLPLLFAHILCNGSTGLSQTEDAKTQLNGTILCEHPVSFEDVKLTAKYVGFRKNYSANSLPPSESEQLPPSIPVDASGNFSVACISKPMMFHCSYGDKELVGSAQIDSPSEELTIKLGPAVIVTGRLIDAETGAPLAKKRLIASLRFVDADREANSQAAEETWTDTDDDGKFEFSGLVADRKYDLAYIEISPQHSVTLYRVGSFQTNRSRLDLKDIDRTIAWFSSDDSPVARFKKATIKASLANENVLVVFSTPGDEVFHKFAGFRRSEDLRSALQEFQVVAVDRSGDNVQFARELAGKLGIELSDTSNETSFCFTDRQGNLLQEVIVDSGDAAAFPGKPFLEAAKKHAPTSPDVKAILAAALERAGEEGKLVLVQETGPFCGPCVLLSKFLESTRHLWGKDLIWIKLDQRWPGTFEITDKLRNDVESTIPWYAVLDKDGKTVFTSFTEDSKNAGFPGSNWSRKHFRKMLSECCKRMTAEDVEAMLEVLDQ